MTSKELFLTMESYEEFEKHREVFKGLVVDKEINEHIKKIFPETYPPTGMCNDAHFDLPRVKENEWLFEWN